jgi:hypothetical protein
MLKEKEINHRGKALSMLINLKSAYKEKDVIAAEYIGNIIDTVMIGWKKEEKKS